MRARIIAAGVMLACVLFMSAATANQRGKPKINIGKLEKRIHALINQERKKRGLGVLGWDDHLRRIAGKHSHDMARNNFFSHTNPKGEDATKRGLKARYECRKEYPGFVRTGIAENIFFMTTYESILIVNGKETYNWKRQEDIARQAVEGWMKSKGHRKNILNPEHGAEGIGVAIRGEKVFITQNFC